MLQMAVVACAIYNMCRVFKHCSLPPLSHSGNALYFLTEYKAFSDWMRWREGADDVMICVMIHLTVSFIWEFIGQDSHCCFVIKHRIASF